MDRQGAALVHAIIEHLRSSWLCKQHVLRLLQQLAVVHPRVVGGRDFAGMLEPEPLRVTGKALVEPDIAPLHQADRIAEPLMGKLMGDQPLPRALAIAMVAAKHALGLGFKGDLQPLGGDHHLVAGEGIRPEHLAVDLHHLSLIVEILMEALPHLAGLRRAIGQPRAHGDFLFAHLRRAQNLMAERAHVHRGQVGGHGVIHHILASGLGPGRGLLNEVTGCHRDNIPVRGHADAIGGFLIRGVVAGEPAGSAIGLTSHESTFVGLLPTHGSPRGAQRMRLAGIADGDLEGKIRGQLIGEGEAQLVVALGIAAQLEEFWLRGGQAVAGEFHGSHAQGVGQIQGEGLELPVVLHRQRGRGVQKIRPRVVIHIQEIRMDVESQVVIHARVRVAGSIDWANA